MRARHDEIARHLDADRVAELLDPTRYTGDRATGVGAGGAGAVVAAGIREAWPAA